MHRYNVDCRAQDQKYSQTIRSAHASGVCRVQKYTALEINRTKSYEAECVCLSSQHGYAQNSPKSQHRNPTPFPYISSSAYVVTASRAGAACCCEVTHIEIKCCHTRRVMTSSRACTRGASCCYVHMTGCSKNSYHVSKVRSTDDD